MTQETQHAIKTKDSFEEYLSADYIGSSRLKKAKRSGYHYKYQQDQESSAQKLGRAIHCALLEPEKFTSLYTYFSRENMPHPNSTMNKKENRDYKESFEKEARENGQELLEEVEWILCNRLNEQIKETEIYDLVINSDIEQSYYTQDPETGLYLKSRPDSIYENRGIIFNLKSTTNAHPPIFRRDVQKYDYPLQAAFHNKVCELVTGKKIQDYFYIVAEKQNPYCISIFRLNNEDLDKAMNKVNYLLKYIKYWENNQYFPSYEMYADDNEFGVIDLSLDFYYWDE